MPELVDKHSSVAASNLLSLFTVPPTQVSIDSSHYQAVHLTSAVKSDGPFCFIIPPGPYYFHMAKNYLLITMKITKADGIKPAVADVVAPINLIGRCIFKQCRLALNGRVVYDSGPMLAYRSFLETELNYS